MPTIHDQLINAALERFQSDPEVIGVMLQGSLARGDGYPTSDLDLFLLLLDGCPHRFLSEQQNGILVEVHASDLERAITKIRANPMLTYGYTDGKILRDDTGNLAKIALTAKKIITTYRTAPQDLEGILYWLQSAHIKIKAARDAGDNLKASFVVATTSWKILGGMWAVNDLPMPPSGAVLAHRQDLTRAPDNWEELFQQLFLENVSERMSAALHLIEWLLPTL